MLALHQTKQRTMRWKPRKRTVGCPTTTNMVALWAHHGSAQCRMREVSVQDYPKRSEVTASENTMLLETVLIKYPLSFIASE